MRTAITNSTGALDLGAAHLDSIAVADIFLDCCRQHGVAISRLIGPAPNRHHSPPKHPANRTARTATTIASRLTQRSRASHRRNLPMPSPSRCRPEFERDNRPARAMAGSLVVVLIPVGINPIAKAGRRCANSTLRAAIPCHCLSVLALIIKQIAVGILRVDA